MAMEKRNVVEPRRTPDRELGSKDLVKEASDCFKTAPKDKKAKKVQK